MVPAWPQSAVMVWTTLWAAPGNRRGWRVLDPAGLLENSRVVDGRFTKSGAASVYGRRLTSELSTRFRVLAL